MMEFSKMFVKELSSVIRMNIFIPFCKIVFMASVASNTVSFFSGTA